MTDDELDLIVAEKVLGWTDCRRERFGMLAFDGLPPGKRRKTDYAGYPRCSRGMAAAWLVVDAMRARGFRLSIAEWAPGTAPRNKPWVAIFWSDEPLQETGDADTAPRAICLAALRALGVEVDL